MEADRVIVDQSMTKSYYDALTPYYKLIYPNWDVSVKRQAGELDRVIREFAGERAITILDAACGIGTQSIGLADLGYQVTASDISGREIEYAKEEAARYGLRIQFQEADMLQAWEIQQKQFDVVIACDNAIPHLLSVEEIHQAFTQFYQCTKLGGACIISVRDYAQLARKAHQKQLIPRLVHPIKDGQIVMFDVWHYYDDNHYEITTYLVEDNGSANVKTEAIRGGKYYCVEISVLERLMIETGFQQVSVLRDRFFQPLLVANK